MDVSVALCTYNGERFLQEQLASIAAQWLLPFELVVRDDRSTDSTVQIVEDFAKEAPFPVRLAINEERVGSNENFARGIADCVGEAIALSDQDDIWHPNKLSELAGALAERSDIGLVFSDAALVDENLSPLGRTLWECLPFPPEKQARLRSPDAFSILLGSNVVTGATAMFRSEYKEFISPIPSHIPVGHDGWIALVISALADIEPLDKPLIDYRQHPNQQIGAPNLAGGQGQSHNPPAMAKEQKREQYRRRLHLLECLDGSLSRAQEAGSSPRLDAALWEIQDRAKHLHARLEMPRLRLSRLPAVLREIASGRYARYSSGVRSAVVDLLN